VLLVPLHGFFGIDAAVGDVVNFLNQHGVSVGVVVAEKWATWGSRRPRDRAGRKAIGMDHELSCKQDYSINL
jgi:hypothetical protein